MEEVDAILILSLKSLGCEIDDDIRTIKQFNPNLVYQAIVFSLVAVNESYEGRFPSSLPPNMSTRVNLCSELVGAVKELGYRTELGYHHILYPNENDTRQLLIFLDDHRPKDNLQSDNTTSGDLLKIGLEQKGAFLSKETWRPWFSCLFSLTPFSPIWILVTHPITSPIIPPPSIHHLPPNAASIKEFQAYVRQSVDYVTAQPPIRQNVIPSILEHNISGFIEFTERENEANSLALESGLSPWEYFRNKRSKVSKVMSSHIRNAMGDNSGNAGLFGSYATFVQDLLAHDLATRRRTKATVVMVKGTRFTREVDFREKEAISVKTDAEVHKTEQDFQAAREKEIKDFDAQIAKLTNELQNLQNEIETWTSGLRQTEANIIATQRKKEGLEDEYRVKKRTCDLLPDAENNIRLLKQISQQSAQRLIELATEWEQHRLPLLNQIRELSHQISHANDDSKSNVEKIRALRATMREYVQDIQKKEERYKQLIDMYNRLPKEINRSLYTQRILEIVKNVKKQKVDIEKILIDIKSLKKEISGIYDTLNRSFASTSNLIWKDALNKDPTAKQAFKDLAAMHEKVNSLAEKVEETGSAKNSILNLNEKMEQITMKTESLDLKQLLEDSQRVKTENQALVAKIKSLSAKNH